VVGLRGLQRRLHLAVSSLKESVFSKFPSLEWYENPRAAKISAGLTM
jgi:hypothetical protein